jgi:DNA-binding transcriptional ArsR family regulator
MAASPTDRIEVIRGAGRAALVLQRTRRELLAQLAEPDSAAGLARRLGLPRQRLNYHLRELEREGLVECVEERRKGNCTERLLRATARSYVISPDAIGLLGTTPETARDRFSTNFLVASTAQTLRDVTSLEARAREQNKRLSTLTLESEIRFSTAAARAAFAEELTAAIAVLVARYHDDHAPAGRRFRMLTVVHPSAAVPDASAPSTKELSWPTPSQPPTRRPGRSKWPSTSTRRRSRSGTR